MNKYAIITILILSFTITSLLLINYTGVVGNKKIISEIEELEIKSSRGELLTEDVSVLKDMVKRDHMAFDYVEEIEWLLVHNYTNHITHSLGFLYNYIQTGEYKPCIPHEIGHMGLYLKENDERMLEHKLREIDQNYADWFFRVKREFGYSQLYLSNLNDIDIEMRHLLKYIKSGRFDEDIFNRSQVVSESVLC